MDGVDFRTTDMDKWGVGTGAGTGGNLTPLQLDLNFWELLTRIQAFENDPPEAISVNGFTVIGSQFQVNMSDGSTRGPYDLPIAVFQDKGTWTNDLPLNVTDTFSVLSGIYGGYYLVKIAHTTPPSPAVFDPTATDEDTGSPTFGDPLYQKVFSAPSEDGGGGSGVSNEFLIHIPGVPGDGMASGDPIWFMTVPHAMALPPAEAFTGDPGDFTNWVASVWYQSEVGDGLIQFDVNLNGSRIATIEFPEGNGYAVISREDSDPHSLAVGDTLSINTTTGSPTTNLKNMAITLKFDPA